MVSSSVGQILNMSGKIFNGSVISQCSIGFFSNQRESFVKWESPLNFFQPWFYVNFQLDDAAVAINATMKRHFILGGASDVKLWGRRFPNLILVEFSTWYAMATFTNVSSAMETTRKLLDENDSGNDQMVIFMARGEWVYDDLFSCWFFDVVCTFGDVCETSKSTRFRDGQAINCCDDPSDASAAVRAKATIQGVVIGGFPNKVWSLIFDGQIKFMDQSSKINFSRFSTSSPGRTRSTATPSFRWTMRLRGKEAKKLL